MNANLVQLYQSLSTENCAELYKMQKANLDFCDRRIALAIIGAKFVYGDSYRPGVNKEA